MPPNNPATPEETTPQSKEPATNTSESPITKGGALPRSSSHASFNQPVRNSKKKLRLPVIIAGLLILLIGGSAAAYYGVVVPNKPENVLSQAFVNTLQEKQFRLDGKITFENIEKSGTGIKAGDIIIKGQADTEKKNFQTELELTLSGIKLPAELRLLDNDLYFKVDDLTTIGKLIANNNAALAPVVGQLASKLSNQWILVDHTLLKQFGADCELNSSLAFNKDDIRMLESAYKQHTFAAVKSTKNDTINGKSAIKYELEIDDNKGSEYFKSLNKVSVIENIKKCNDTKQANTQKQTDNKTPLVLWVDKASKRIVKFSGQTTQQDAAKNHIKGTIESNIGYGGVNVTKPEGAKPLVEVISDLKLGSAPKP